MTFTTEQAKDHDKEYAHYMEDAVSVAIAAQRASVGLFSRRLAVDYALARSLLDDLETLGVIAAGDGTKPHEVLVKTLDEAMAIIDSRV